jgi:putative transcriptional regulator
VLQKRDILYIIEKTKQKGACEMLTYKIDVLKELAQRGYTANRMRREKILSESTMQNLRNKSDINTKTLNTLCIILRCQPSDIIEIVPTDDEKIKYF